MSKTLKLLYFVGMFLVPIVLTYPAFIYLDLAGMGGYDGFASVDAMLEYGAWSAQETLSITRLAIEAIYFLWLFSLLHLLIVLPVFVYRWLDGKFRKL